MALHGHEQHHEGGQGDEQCRTLGRVLGNLL